MKKTIAIVGTGAGGGTLAKELAKAGCQVIIIEQGKTCQKVGSVSAALKFYEGCGLVRSEQGIIVYRTMMTGGTTVVSCGNAMRSELLQKKFLEFGINLEPYYTQAERELGVNFPRQTATANLITAVAERIGYNFVPIPKMIGDCHYCGHCELGCKFGAKWTAINFVDEAVKKNSAKLITEAEAIKVLSKNGVVSGVQVRRNKSVEDIVCDIVILAAGGVGTPRILENSGIFSAGNGLFCDPFHVTYGIMSEIQNLGFNMPTVYYGDGFILSPFLDQKIHLALLTKLKFHFKHHFQHYFQHEKLLGIMTKIADFRNGRVANNEIFKCILEEDQQKLDKGFSIARQILLEAGARSIIVTPVRGAHPGGTVEIGRTVDENLQAKKLKGLFICDASVLPIAPGLPPILTIVALAKWLANRIQN